MFILKVSNPHDKFFKENFSKVEVAKSFVENYLPSEVLKIIDINTLKPQKDSFINKDLEEVFSDMLFKVNINGEVGYLYFLFEHKSYVSPNVAFQLLRYIINASKTLAKEDIEKVIEEVTENYSEGSEVIMTIAKIWEAQGIEKGRKEGLKQGMQRGIQQGMQQGMQEGKLEVARNLIKTNLSTEQIAEVTGLELQRIEKLRDQIERQENQETN